LQRQFIEAIDDGECGQLVQFKKIQVVDDGIANQLWWQPTKDQDLGPNSLKIPGGKNTVPLFVMRPQ
jgi:hypothetical protein